MPDILCIQFNTKRSAFKIDCEEPSTVNTISPFLITAPSSRIVFTVNCLSTSSKMSFAKATPAKMPSSFTSNFARP